MTETAQRTFAVTVRVDAARTVGELRPIWRFFGADEPNYATHKDGQRLLADLGQLSPQQVYFRTHNLLTSGDGTPALKWGSTGIYSEDTQGNPIYDWTIADGIFDAYLAHGVLPYVQIGFMPKALSIHPDPYQHHWTSTASYDEIYTGWAYPPKDYSQWAELVYQWTKHCVGRYGREAVEHWYWQTWNEPNIGYWRGTPEGFHQLHDFAVDAVRRALPTARVGGPDVAGDGGAFMQDFLAHCLHGTNYATGQIGTPLDFVSFHAKGAPKFVDGHVQMGIAEQLRTIDRGFGLIASYTELHNISIVIGECDPDGCAACQGPQLGYRNGTLYSSYTAASFARIHALAAKHQVHLEGALTWAFEFEDQPYFDGFRVLASNGLALPVLNVFRMFSRMGGQQVTTESSSEVLLAAILQSGVRTAPDVSAMASLDGDTLSVLLWHYHDVDIPGPDADIMLVIDGLPSHLSTARLEEFRIDADHSNAYTAWQRLGSPQTPTTEQYELLEKASHLASMAEPTTIPVEAGHTQVSITLPRQGVSLIQITEEPTPSR